MKKIISREISVLVHQEEGDGHCVQIPSGWVYLDEVSSVEDREAIIHFSKKDKLPDGVALNYRYASDPVG